MDDNCVIDMDISVTENEDDVELDVETCRQAVLWSTDWTVETIINQMVKVKLSYRRNFKEKMPGMILEKVNL